MSHNKNFIAIVYRTLDCICNNTHTHLADLFGSSGSTSEKFVNIVAYNSNLISASAKRHIKRLSRIGFAVFERVYASAQTDRYRSGMLTRFYAVNFL